MTNEEAIKILESMRVFRNGSNANVEAIDIAINSIQENAKLKAEIEQLKDDSKIIAKELVTQIREIDKLKHQIETRIKVSEANFNIYLKLETERDNLIASVDQLKSELEQSVKEKSEIISKIEYALNECEPIYNKCAVVPQAKPVYDLAMNYCLDLLKGQVPE